jgi:hypothetical protein
MDQTETNDATPVVGGAEAELKEILGMFEAPAFARRGHELEHALRRLDLRLARERNTMLDMVRLRLRQWASVASGPDDWRDLFTSPIAPLYTLTAADPPAWAPHPSPHRRRRTVARDLVASVDRFNRRWVHLVENLRLDSVNRQVEHYNRYYVLEKECIIGSARLAARHFTPRPRVTPALLLADHPTLPLPALAF